MTASDADPAAYPVQSVFPTSTCIRRGHAPVGAARLPEPIDVYYEIHGDRSPSASKVVLIAGLSNSSFSWEHQLLHFTSKPGYTVLAFDNRGVGNSSSPKGRYKTSDMALDTIELFDHLGWTEDKSLHVVGWSMGGMLSLEMATLIPERLASLTLLSTKAGGTIEIPTLPVASMFFRLLTGLLRPADALPVVQGVLFPHEWLSSPSPDRGANGRTNGEVELSEAERRFAIGRRQTKDGSNGQICAVYTHKVTKDRLVSIAENVPRVAVVTGYQDLLINYSRSVYLHQNLPGSTLKVWKEGGHATFIQYKEEFNELLEGVIAEGRARCLDGPAS